MRSADLPRQPSVLFHDWFDAASREESSDPRAVVLATASADALPSARIVLFKAFQDKGLQGEYVFFTNSNSPKAHDLTSNPQAELLFYWPTLYRQVRIRGSVYPISRERSVTYFESRPFGSKISSLVSQQSMPVESRAHLEKEVAELTERYQGQEPPCPAYWQGYAVAPVRYEFWLGQNHRLHDRFCYHYSESAHDWSYERLSP